MKKFASILVSVLLVFAMMIPAFAAGEYSITINNTKEGHTYKAYQVFSGPLNDTEDGLNDIKWGTGVDGAALLAALKIDPLVGTDFTDATTAAAAAAIIGTYANDSDKAQAVARVIAEHLETVAGETSTKTDDGTYVIADLDSGYYLVTDQDSNLTGDDAYTRYILNVVKDVTINPKSSTPTVEKKVLEESYTQDGGYGVGYNDVADYDIGDSVPFELIGTLPSTLVDYETYSYVFRDTLSTGLTFNNDVTVTIDGVTVNPASYTVNAEGQSFTVSFNDIKAVTSTDDQPIAVTGTSKVYVKYTATLNANAVIGLDGNPNEVDLTYSNNPEGEGTGTTPKDKAIVFTYELDVNKVDANTQEKLADAKFKLYRKVDGANSYAIVDADSNKVTGWTDSEENATVLTSDDQGFFKVIGLDDGEYFLKETEAPTGYNKLEEDVAFTISSDHDGEDAEDYTNFNQNWAGDTAGTVLVDLDITVGGQVAQGAMDTGIVSMTVENNSGSTLPSTGGIGTTIFTVAGIALMLGAAVILITRRKVTANAAA